MVAPASRKIGKYGIVRKLGRGGMADVYLAQDTETGDTVALKLIEHATDPDTIAAIEAERRGAELQARLAAIDPRVVRVYGAGDADGFFFVAMEYIDGQDLAELMRRGPLALGFATEVAIAVAKTLDNAHNLRIAIDGKEFRGVVHGDIKPKNIRIDGRGEVRVLDFGIAKALSMSRRLTRNEFGSVPYASPERLDFGEVDVGSDLWSLAVMLHEMVTGMQPYHAESTERLERMIRSRIAPPPAPDPCPEPLRRILIKSMAPNPALRYPSAARLRCRPRSLPGRCSGGCGKRRPRRHAPHLPPARGCGRRRDAPHRRPRRERRSGDAPQNGPPAAPADVHPANQSGHPVNRPPPTASPCGSCSACSLPESCSAPGP